jgi:hypothetical protein
MTELSSGRNASRHQRPCRSRPGPSHPRKAEPFPQRLALEVPGNGLPGRELLLPQPPGREPPRARQEPEVGGAQPAVRRRLPHGDEVSGFGHASAPFTVEAECNSRGGPAQPRGSALRTRLSSRPDSARRHAAATGNGHLVVCNRLDCRPQIAALEEEASQRAPVRLSTSCGRASSGLEPNASTT